MNIMTVTTKKKRELAMLYNKLGNWVNHYNGCVKFKFKFNDKSLYTMEKQL